MINRNGGIFYFGYKHIYDQPRQNTNERGRGGSLKKSTYPIFINSRPEWVMMEYLLIRNWFSAV